MVTHPALNGLVAVVCLSCAWNTRVELRLVVEALAVRAVAVVVA
jgi:hypothetical protein